LEAHRRTVHDLIEFSKTRQTAVVNPTRKPSSRSPGFDYTPTGTINSKQNLGSLTNLLSLSEKSDKGAESSESKFLGK